MEYVNISGYEFTNMSDLTKLQVALNSNCKAFGLKGTIILSGEGINAFLSGKRSSIDLFYDYLRTIKLPAIKFKESLSANSPFDRMFVKIKPEIVTMGLAEISPAKARAPFLSPEIFKQWLDENKDIHVIDTRNTYEIDLGRFKNAMDMKISHFRAFPMAAEELPTDLKEKTIVTYCTGGIRCEKAALFLMAKGFNHVYQLEGGILSYLETCGNKHFEGACFVFDKRISVSGESYSHCHPE